MVTTENFTVSPKYAGDPTETLPQRLLLRCPYLKTIPISNWDIQEYMRNGGDPRLLLDNLLALSKNKSLPRNIRRFAFIFHGHFTGDMGEKRLRILRNKLKDIVDRRVIEGNELTAAQDRVIDRQERNKTAPTMAPEAIGIEPELLSETEVQSSVMSEVEGDAETRVPRPGMASMSATLRSNTSGGVWNGCPSKRTASIQPERASKYNCYLYLG
ncbi:hypothetical protein BC939DRAFT_493358 [Gamsiella multidivaricata]|uniref:uncharacterized protein n=1 Tax=Gamsiella multidivaricata TaxID=101098 RepID=UPI0022208040|nr:uncharacterized protein BC939DRAFT_493358 [Gamsiella multidivaricata]KAI7822896.1 hypothetical protein BC939DRAFT_493358 [Gamsiella multidivaricata]